MLSRRPRALLFLLWLLQLLSSGAPQVPCPSRPHNYEKELKKCLLQDYDKSVRPAADSETVTVSIYLHIRSIDLVHTSFEDSNLITIHSWTGWQWTDKNLAWQPADYQDLYTITMFSDDIWHPDVSLITTGDASMHFSLPSTYCHVFATGEVTCAPPTTFFGHCVPDVSRWPFDEQTCTVTLGSWSEPASKINLTLDGPWFTMEMMPKGPWKLVSEAARVVQTPQGNDTYPVVEFTFVLRRFSAFDASTSVVPALVLSTMTLLTFLLEPGCSERLTMGGTSVLAHVLYLEYFTWRLPRNGHTAPAIVVFFRDSLVLLGGALVLAIATRRLMRARTPPPDWLRSVAASLLAHAPGQLLLLGRLSPRGAAASSGTAGEDGATLVAAGDAGSGLDRDKDARQQPDDTWRLAAVFVDRVALGVFFVALLGLFARYVA